MIFKDRREAGLKLATALKKYEKDSETVVLGLPRGGVEVAFYVSQELNLPLDVIVSRKIGAPFNPEFAIGAVSEDGEAVINEEMEDLQYIEKERKKEEEEARRRARVYRKKKELPDLVGKTVILVDDGIATGATMEAVIKSVKKRNVGKIVIAVPVAAPDSLKAVEDKADEAVCLLSPAFFTAVGAFYENFEQLDDKKVLRFLKGK